MAARLAGSRPFRHLAAARRSLAAHRYGESAGTNICRAETSSAADGIPPPLRTASARSGYQRAICGLAVWLDANESGRTLARSVSGSFDTTAVEAPWPALFQGDYELCEPSGGYRGWHLAPTGRPGGRPYFAFLSSYQFQPTVWDFGRPLAQLLRTDFPLALCVDILKTWDRNDAINEIESVVQAYSVHLATTRGEDSRSVKKVIDCRQALEELNLGDALHDAQIVIAIAAPDRKTLKKRVDEVMHLVKPWFLLRAEIGEAQSEGGEMLHHSRIQGHPHPAYHLAAGFA
ncbi:hypothetical protein QPK87_28925 [Kamptonema cortianum]|nr:hypothetical protein [Kamptonema cortianum]